MKVILLSGGSGKRLWPMSNQCRSKQFLRVLKDEEGKSVSMLQRVWQQLASAGLSDDAYICASKPQHEAILSQLGKVPFIEEPERRDTFPAIALSVSCLHDVIGCADDETVVVMPVDPYVNDTYFSTLQQMEAVLNLSGAEMVLMGVKPNKPTSKFGYIQVAPERVINGKKVPWYKIDSFIEKPSEANAIRLIHDGALWNCGVFCFHIGFLRKMIESFGYPSGYRQLVARFPELPAKSFDYEIVEKVEKAVVVSYDGQWSDLGTWEALSAKMGDEFVGSGIPVDCQDTQVINELGIPLVAMGLSGVVVVSTPDGILVSSKESAAKLKNVTASINSRPMYEEKRWGIYRVLDFRKLEDGSEVLTKYIEVGAGKNISYQKHMKRSEVWTVIQGHGEFALDSRITEVGPGDVLRIYPEQWHGIRAIDNLSFIEVQRGSELVEEDIERRFFDWNELLEYCAVAL